MQKAQNQPAHNQDCCKNLKVAVVRARWNDKITKRLADECSDTLNSLGVKSVQECTVPGANELPYAVKLLKKSGDYDAIVAVGLQCRDLCGGELKPAAAGAGQQGKQKGAACCNKCDESCGCDAANPNSENFKMGSQSLAYALMKLGLSDDMIPVINGVLYVPGDESQVEALGSSGQHHFGKDWAQAAVEMACFGKKCCK